MTAMPPSTFHIERRPRKHGRSYRAVVYVGARPDGPSREYRPWRRLEREAREDGKAMLEALAQPQRTAETLGELLDRWLRDYASGATEETTLAHYRRIVTDHLVGVQIRNSERSVKMGDVLAADLTASDFAEWQALQLETQAPKTVRNNRVPLGEALSWAVELGELATNELAKVPRPKLRRKPVEPPAIAAVQEHLEALKGTRYYRPALIAAATGMRRGEVLGLEWRHVDLERHVIHVRQNVRQIGVEVTTVPYLKTHAGRRDLPLPAFVAEALRREWVKARLAGEAKPSDRVCGHMKPDSLTGGLRAAWDRKKLPRVKMHMLRHALASSMLAAGVPMLEVQAFLGHKDVTTTLGTYGHLLPGALGDAAKTYDGAWEAAKQKAAEEAEKRAAQARFEETNPGSVSSLNGRSTSTRHQ